MPIVIEGLEELSNLLATLAPAAAKRYLSRCAEPAAQVVLDAMAQTVPGPSTGHESFGFLEEELGSQKKWLDGDETTIEIDIGPLRPAFWGSFQEFGTFDQPATHWMGNAWESSKNQCLDVFATEALGILADLEQDYRGQ
jgi:HK97 gp10 family phage protein